MSAAGNGHIKVRVVEMFTVINYFLEVQDLCELQNKTVSVSECRTTNIYDLRISNVLYISITYFHEEI